MSRYHQIRAEVENLWPYERHRGPFPSEKIILDIFAAMIDKTEQRFEARLEEIRRGTVSDISAATNPNRRS